MTRSGSFASHSSLWLWVPAFAGTTVENVALLAYLTRLALLQLFSDDHTPRDSRKQSTGVDEPSARKRCSWTPLHWKPHFSSTLREVGLVTRAPA